MPIRVLLNPGFTTWSRKSGITDTAICVAANEVEAGLIDARLGGFLIKKRVQAPGRGKSGGFRTLIGYRQGNRLIFVHGFAKNESENITNWEKETLRRLCDLYMSFDDEKIDVMITDSEMVEITCHEPNN